MAAVNPSETYSMANLIKWGFHPTRPIKRLPNAPQVVMEQIEKIFTHPNCLSVINLPPVYNPMYVDRFIQNMYTGKFTMDAGGKASRLHEATRISQPNPDIYATQDFPTLAFYLHMYAVGEKLGSEGFMATTYDKPAGWMLMKYD
ncbi:hypothetical protein P154DRAFT_581120 [Amniculicola lignicola CBS 123094]|uniref:Uncharacterized protein n=1 Tax=Amniculicola lignicola CBS 123094 TaxID=1392246 RepID=A0A6A5W7V6_9PLEO|nr:hypothetical protein P154DRAFT_581120 [Amniculicola lignicola CBS 123094]